MCLLALSCPEELISSLIVALMQARCSRPVHTFAIGFDDKRYDETTYARAVANSAPLIGAGRPGR